MNTILPRETVAITPYQETSADGSKRRRIAAPVEATISTLPVAVLKQIFSNFSAEEGARLSGVSRQWHSLLHVDTSIALICATINHEKYPTVVEALEKLVRQSPAEKSFASTVVSNMESQRESNASSVEKSLISILRSMAVEDIDQLLTALPKSSLPERVVASLKMYQKLDELKKRPAAVANDPEAVELVTKFLAVDDLPGALPAASAIEDEATRNTHFVILVERLLAINEIKRAFVLARDFITEGEDKYRSKAFHHIAMELIERGDLKLAKWIAKRLILDPSYEEDVYCGLACKYAELGNLDKALKCAGLINDEYFYACALNAIVLYLVDINLAFAIAKLNEIQDEAIYSNTVQDCVEILASQDKFAEALHLAGAVNNEDLKKNVMEKIQIMIENQIRELTGKK